MFNYNSTTETINPNENNATQPGDSGTGSTETATQDDTTTGTATQDDTTTGTATQDEMTTPPVPSEGAAPIQNFAGTGDPDAGRDLRYPFDHTSAYDFIKIFPMKYIPAMQSGNMIGGIDSLRQNASSHFSQVGQRYQNAEKAGSMVFLPMIPAGETNSTGWGDQDRMNAIQKEFGIAASKIISGAFSQGEEWAAESLSSLKDAAAGLVLENSGLNQFITAHFAGKAVSANLLGRSGVAINPNLELLFSGPSLRNFTYNFTFTPRGRKETQEVRDIIKVFKKGMAPKRTEQHMFLNVPHVLNVEYVYNSQGSSGSWQHP